jgi:hypothetical protein
MTDAIELYHQTKNLQAQAATAGFAAAATALAAIAEMIILEAGVTVVLFERRPAGQARSAVGARPPIEQRSKW